MSRDEQAAALVAEALLALVSDAPAATAAHLAAAIGRHRRDRAHEGIRVAALEDLERIFAGLGTSARRGVKVQDGAVFAGSAQRVDGEPMTDLLTREQTSKRMRCSVDTVKRREADGSLTPVRNGRLVFHRVADIDAYLNGAA